MGIRSSTPGTGGWYCMGPMRGGRRGRRGRRGSGKKRGAPSACRGSFSSALGRRRRLTSGRPCTRGMMGTPGMTGMTRGTRVTTRGRGVTRGARWGVTTGVRRKGTRGVRRWLPGARMRPGNPPSHRGGNPPVRTRERGAGGHRGLIGLIGLTHQQETGRRPAKGAFIYIVLATL